MFKSYREIFSYPGALRFSLAGAVARFPMAMAGLSTLLMISTLYGEYSLAGQVTGKPKFYALWLRVPWFYCWL